MKLSNQKIGLVLASALFLSQGESKASSTPLAGLIATHGTISVGDEVFGDFMFNSNMFDPQTASVSVIFQNGTYRLTLQGPFISQAGNFADISFGYTVNSISGLTAISSIGQSYVLSALGTGGVVAIGETATAGGGAHDSVQSSVGYFLGVNDAGDPPIETIQGDDLTFALATQEISVETDIALLPNAAGLVGATTVIQTFNPTTVPEPSSGLFLVWAFGGITCLLRWRIARSR